MKPGSTFILAGQLCHVNGSEEIYTTIHLRFWYLVDGKIKIGLMPLAMVRELSTNIKEVA
jgi:hypothetical protein